MRGTDTFANAELIEEMINKATYFQKGETFRCNNSWLCSGYISSSATAIFFTLFLPKRIPEGLTVSVSGSVAIRHTGGGYLVNGDLAAAGTITTTYKDNALRIQIQASAAFSGATNNTPLDVQCSGSSGLLLTFN